MFVYLFIDNIGMQSHFYIQCVQDVVFSDLLQ